MNADEGKYEGEGLNRLTELVIGCAYTVHNTLGAGFLESVYENALVHELRKAGISVLQQVGFDVLYDGIVVGRFTADLAIEGVLRVELKVARAIDDAHVAQCLNYLAATRLRLGIILNFSQRVQVKRLLPRHD